MSRFSVLGFLHSSEEACFGKDISSGPCYNSGILRICCTCPSTVCEWQMGTELPFVLSCLLYYVSTFFYRCCFFCVRGVFLHLAECYLCSWWRWRWCCSPEWNLSVKLPVYFCCLLLPLPHVCTYDNAINFLHFFSTSNGLMDLVS